MKTLNDLLTLPRFSDLEVLSTHKDLNRPLETVEITETPDVANFIPENAIVLTTAMIYRDDQLKIKKLIDSLIPIKCVALGIKVGRFIEEIHPEVIAYASEVNLPLIKIPSTQPLGGLLHQMLSYLWDSKTQQMAFAFDVQKRFSYLLTHDVNNARFIAEFGKILNTPIILLNPWHKVIAHSKHFSGTQKPASFYVDQLSQKNFKRIDQEEQALVIQDIDGKPLQISAMPIHVNNYFPYYLIILEPEKMPYPISEFAIEQALLVLTFILYKNQKVEESYDNLKTDFLNQMLDAYQRTSTEQQNWLDLGKNYGLVGNNYYQIAIVYFTTDQTTQTRERYQQEEAQIILNWLKENLPLKMRDVALFKLKNRNESVLIFQNEHEGITQVLEDLSQELHTLLPIQIKFALGNAYQTLDELTNSYIEASQTLENCDQLVDAPLVQHFQPKGLAGLLKKIGDKDVHYFCEKNLKELAYPVEPTFQELRKTLKTFLDFNCEITKTAKVLFLHRNTIKYRINQCEELLDLSITDPESNLILRVALELSEN
ncbi:MULTISPECIES: PucR family transcriptional regulator [Enterococcus]|uniref:PucR family transcriptional regulator n=1 Tax=Enterococcus alishanensis TaxID=1303817 RepID=A0ABS6TA60_9ENTE|nr:PucR family transcriptional regulator [Enterococcus alishanensis]MBV7389788.1 PucR family transcriptional regulator [Enterococcus alishanensis]